MPEFSIIEQVNSAIYDKQFIVNAAKYFNAIAKNRNIDFFVLRQSHNSHCLSVCLFLSDCNYVVAPSGMDEEDIENTLYDKTIFYLEASGEKSFLLPDKINQISPESAPKVFDQLLEASASNSCRRIGYFSSGSTGSPKLIILNSCVSYICHKKVLNRLEDTSEINSLICYHDISFVISLNYLTLGMLLDVHLYYTDPQNVLKLSSIKKIGPTSLLISVPSFLTIRYLFALT